MPEMYNLKSSPTLYALFNTLMNQLMCVCVYIYIYRF
jgi:hypothetical protein